MSFILIANTNSTITITFTLLSSSGILPLNLVHKFNMGLKDIRSLEPAIAQFARKRSFGRMSRPQMPFHVCRPLEDLLALGTLVPVLGLRMINRGVESQFIGDIEDLRTLLASESLFFSRVLSFVLFPVVHVTSTYLALSPLPVGRPFVSQLVLPQEIASSKSIVALFTFKWSLFAVVGNFVAIPVPLFRKCSVAGGAFERFFFAVKKDLVAVPIPLRSEGFVAH